MKKLDLEKVDSRRKELGLTLTELARKVGVSGPAIVQMFSRQTRDPKLSTGLGIAAALECSIEDLLEDEDEPETCAA